MWRVSRGGGRRSASREGFESAAIYLGAAPASAG
jgi:hypothetical protein